ncbi:hypothetical protein QF001_000314 [Paraburkholderia youngii]
MPDTAFAPVIDYEQMLVVPEALPLAAREFALAVR